MPRTLQRARMPTRAQLCEAGCLDLVYSIEVRARGACSACWPRCWRPRPVPAPSQLMVLAASAAGGSSGARATCLVEIGSPPNHCRCV
jgi:hypothetical protein